MGETVDLGDLLAGVGDHELAVGRTDGELLLSLDVAGVHHDLATAHQLVENLAGVLARPHPQGQLGVGGIGEAADGVELGDPVRRVADGEIEDAASSYGRELMAVADEHDRGAGFVGQTQQRPGSVLVEHPGLVDHQQVTAPQLSRGCRAACDAAPAAVFVPAEPVLVQQPGDRVGRRADLVCRDLGGLPRRRHDQHPTTGLFELPCGSRPGGWSCRPRPRPRRS